MKQYCNLNPCGPGAPPAAGSADELSPAINPVWRIILFPSSGQTLSVMKWPGVPLVAPSHPGPLTRPGLRGARGLSEEGTGRAYSVASTPLNLCSAPMAPSPSARPAAASRLPPLALGATSFPVDPHYCTSLSLSLALSSPFLHSFQDLYTWSSVGSRSKVYVVKMCPFPCYTGNTNIKNIKSNLLYFVKLYINGETD